MYSSCFAILFSYIICPNKDLWGFIIRTYDQWYHTGFGVCLPVLHEMWPDQGKSPWVNCGHLPWTTREKSYCYLGENEQTVCSETRYNDKHHFPKVVRNKLSFYSWPIKILRWFWQCVDDVLFNLWVGGHFTSPPPHYLKLSHYDSGLIWTQLVLF